MSRNRHSPFLKPCPCGDAVLHPAGRLSACCASIITHILDSICSTTCIPQLHRKGHATSRLSHVQSSDGAPPVGGALLGTLVQQQSYDSQPCGTQ